MTSSTPLLVVAYDFSPASKAALGQAVEFARKLGARLGLIHVVDEGAYYVAPLNLPPVPIEYLRELEDRFAEQLEAAAASVREAGLACETRLLRGAAVSKILAYLEESKPLMVVMGTHGRTGWRHALLGSVAERVVQRARCPVFVVPDPERE